MPALNSLIQQQHHQIPILVSSIMFITCHLFLTVTLVTLPCHHITMSPSPPSMMTSTTNTTTTTELNWQLTTTSMITMTEGREDEKKCKWCVGRIIWASGESFFLSSCIIHGSAGDGDKHWPPPSPLANSCDHHHHHQHDWDLGWGTRCVHASNPGFFLLHNNNHEWQGLRCDMSRSPDMYFFHLFHFSLLIIFKILVFITPTTTKGAWDASASWAWYVLVFLFIYVS